jgi:hypothetical protein
MAGGAMTSLDVFCHEKHKKARKNGDVVLKLRNEIGLNCAMKSS